MLFGSETITVDEDVAAMSCIPQEFTWEEAPAHAASLRQSMDIATQFLWIMQNVCPEDVRGDILVDQIERTKSLCDAFCTLASVLVDKEIAAPASFNAL